MLLSKFYSFVKVEDEDGIFYQFVTSYNIAYTVYFKIDEYSNYIKDFPLLLQNGYSFGFKRQKFVNGNKNVNDPKIFSTIYKIIVDFFDTYGVETILLYHCDTADNKQAYRNRLFNDWDARLISSNNFEKHSIEVEIGKQEFYLGFIAHTNNLLINDLKSEFGAFAYYIIQPK